MNEKEISKISFLDGEEYNIKDKTARISIEEEVANRVAQDVILQNQIDNEKTTRETNENKLSEEIKKVSIPELTEAQKEDLKNLALEYYNKDDTNYAYYFDLTRNNYANNSIFRDGKVCFNCGTFIQMVWGGIATETFDVSPEEYKGDILKKFDWGYYFKFPWRFLHDLKNPETGKPYGFIQPNPDTLEGSYSYYTYYMETSNDEYKQFYPSMMNACHVAMELYEMGCEIPFSEVDVGDLLFFNDDDLFSDTPRELDAFKNITHVAICTYKSQGKIVFYESTSGVTGAITRRGNTSGYGELSQANTFHKLNRLVMCARHPMAFGITNPTPEKFIEI